MKDKNIELIKSLKQIVKDDGNPSDEVLKAINTFEEDILYMFNTILSCHGKHENQKPIPEYVFQGVSLYYCIFLLRMPLPYPPPPGHKGGNIEKLLKAVKPCGDDLYFLLGVFLESERLTYKNPERFLVNSFFNSGEFTSITDWIDTVRYCPFVLLLKKTSTGEILNIEYCLNYLRNQSNSTFLNHVGISPIPANSGYSSFFD